MLPTRLLKMVLLLVVGIATIAVGLTHTVPVAGQDDADDEATIESAMVPARRPSPKTRRSWMGMATTVLREGSNGWTCFPDANATPASDPMCLDETWLGWLAGARGWRGAGHAGGGARLHAGGGSDASNIDPFATGPEEGNEWITSPAHVMVIMPGDIDQSVFTTDPHSGEPWIMWAGTPYEHVMMPVDAQGMVHGGEMGDMGEMAAATPSS